MYFYVNLKSVFYCILFYYLNQFLYLIILLNFFIFLFFRVLERQCGILFYKYFVQNSKCSSSINFFRQFAFLFTVSQKVVKVLMPTIYIDSLMWIMMIFKNAYSGRNILNRSWNAVLRIILDLKFSFHWVYAKIQWDLQALWAAVSTIYIYIYTLEIYSPRGYIAYFSFV